MTKKVRQEQRFNIEFDPNDRLISIIGEKPKPSAIDLHQLSFPVRVVAEITSRCNMRCDYCSQGENPRGQSVALDDILRAIDQIDDNKTFELSIRGAEAMLHPDFAQVWAYATQKSFVATNLITNGTLLSEEKAMKMLDNPASKIIVSLDGPADVNARFRGENQYPKVMKWLAPALNQRPQQLVVLSTVYQFNFAKIPGFAHFLADIGLVHYHISLLKTLGDAGNEDQKQISYENMLWLKESLTKLRITNPGFKPVISSPFDSRQEASMTDVPITYFTEQNCGTGIKIMADGRIGISQIIYLEDKSQCRFDAEVDREDQSLGNLYQGLSIKEIWDASKELRRVQAAKAKTVYPKFLGLQYPEN